MKIFMKVALPLLLLAAGIIWLIGGAVPEAVVVKVAAGDVRDGVPGNVLILAKRTHDIRARIQGIVKDSRMLPNGKPVTVEENSTLVWLDSQEIERSLEQFKVSREHHERRVSAGSAIAMELESELDELEAFRELAKEKKIPLADLKKKENYVKRLETRLSQEQISIEESSKNFSIREAELAYNLKKMEIRSPIAGEMTISLVAPGDMVSPGAHLGRVISHERIVEVTLNEEDFAGTEDGQEAAVTLLSHGRKIFPANVKRLSPVVDPATGRRKLYLELEGGNDRFAPGSSGRVEIIKSVQRKVLTVPRKALMGNAVFVVKDGFVEIRNVKVGASNLLTAAIIKGLRDGEQVIVETPHLFRDGQKVSPVLAEGS